MVTRNYRQRHSAPALFIYGALALFIFINDYVAASVVAQQAQTLTRPRRRQTTPASTSTPQSSSPTQMPAQTQSQTPPAPDDGDDVIRVTSNLVVVPVSVTDAGGQSVPNLTAGDFRLEEEGRTQEVARIGDAEQVPLELALLLDVSGSVNARFAFEKEAAARFLKQVLKPTDRAAVYAIDNDPRLEQTRASAAAASAKLLRIEPARGATAFYDTVVEAARYLAKAATPGARRVIVVISDGEETNSDRFKTVTATLPEVQRADAIFYAINPSGQALNLNLISRRAQTAMERLADATGGAAFVPEKEEDLDAIFRRIGNELRSQYLLQYYSNDASGNGKFLRIKVRVPARSELRIRARQGYYTKNR